MTLCDVLNAGGTAGGGARETRYIVTITPGMHLGRLVAYCAWIRPHGDQSGGLYHFGLLPKAIRWQTSSGRLTKKILPDPQQAATEMAIFAASPGIGCTSMCGSLNMPVMVDSYSGERVHLSGHRVLQTWTIGLRWSACWRLARMWRAMAARGWTRLLEGCVRMVCFATSGASPQPGGTTKIRWSC